MVVGTTWSDPSVAGSGAGLDLATGDVLTEVVYDRLISDLNRLGGTDGNAKTGKYQIGTATSYSNAKNTGGLTIQQGTAVDEILSLKNTNIAGHGITSITETDTFADFTVYSSTQGGLLIRGLGSDKFGVYLEGNVTTGDTTKSSAAVGALRIRGSKKSGTTVAALGANENIVVIDDGNVTRFILDADGDSHQDIGTTWTNFHAYDDIALLNLLTAHVTRDDDPLKRGFAQWLEQRREPLEQARLVTFNDDGHHFVNMSRLAMLLVGAAIQTGQRLRLVEDHLAQLAG
jgi:hypothetical protein